MKGMRASLAAFALAALILISAALPAYAVLSARSAFTLIRRIPPGETLSGAVSFLGQHASEWVVDAAAKVKVRRWGTEGEDDWYFDVLHDGAVVRAARITWPTASKREQQAIFSQLTTEGKKFFGRPGTFRGMSEAEWKDFDGRWLVRAKLEAEISGGVTLLSGIRDEKMDSGKFGF